MTGGYLILLPLAARFFLLARISSHPVAPIAEKHTISSYCFHRSPAHPVLSDRLRLLRACSDLLSEQKAARGEH
ncbi:hypothetical protein BO83DRAFT_383830 [Aspergillus eucalypticola CBS 122712]|uniref:Secreted protein n=1 Tax=Aspergillus eucalypticola (strain CBS 122712 / IBT 29274) TaxID=1448314 RepID=A0A317UJ10_ASPEC|nr:uncharacterized protein BO83DRAFT_383830 [Aspergillus eucalypticola CBS 122712]PWY61671.1 hypothetical protein BO83DRAFT_383830 [Aspergillus eucalypticola CBS 122712]